MTNLEATTPHGTGDGAPITHLIDDDTPAYVWTLDRPAAVEWLRGQGYAIQTPSTNEGVTP